MPDDDLERAPAEPPVEEVLAGEPEQPQPDDVPPTPPASPPPEDADPDGEAPIEAGSLRADPRVGREMYGGLFAGIAAQGPAQFGNHNEMHNYSGKKPLDPIIGKLPGVDQLMEVYAPSAADGQLDDLVSQRSAVCLTGPRNTGRYSTARAALCRHYAADSVYEIALPTDVSAEVLVGKPDRLPKGCGFVLRLSGKGHVDAMRRLSPLFRRRDSTLLLIKDAEPHYWDMHGAEVRHRAPDALEVFRRHLRVSLPRVERGGAENYLTDQVRQALKSANGPKECVAIAHAIAKERPADESAMQAILDRTRPKLRDRAVAVLLPDAEGSAPHGRRATQHERAFRLSYAVFHRRPMHYVFEAADWLLREIDSAALRPDWGKMALQHPVHTLLGDELRRDWEAARETVNAPIGASRVAWIRDNGLRGAIIDVAWHEFDATRRSLLQWLDRLVIDGDEVMRRAAAETAGLLVHHDFERVHVDLVDVWAAARKSDVRQAAAWTMTYADMAGDIGPRVRAKLSEWCSGLSNYRRDTAARVYASGMEQTVLAWSMVDLARIARDRSQKRRYVVAEAVNQLYRPERAGWILAELNVWAGAELLQIHAARALLILAGKTDPNAADGRPELLGHLAEGSVDVRDLGRLWLVALLEPQTEPAAADALARWIRHADVNDELRRHVVGLLGVIGEKPVMRRRVDFYLGRTFLGHDTLPEWARKEERRDS